MTRSLTTRFDHVINFMIGLEVWKTLQVLFEHLSVTTVGGRSASFGKSLLKHSKNFQIILSNQKLARESRKPSRI